MESAPSLLRKDMALWESLTLAKCIWPPADVWTDCILKVHTKSSILNWKLIFYTKKYIISGMTVFRIPHKSFYNPYIPQIYAISKGGILALLYTALWWLCLGSHIQCYHVSTSNSGWTQEYLSYIGISQPQQSPAKRMPFSYPVDTRNSLLSATLVIHEERCPLAWGKPESFGLSE